MTTPTPTPTHTREPRVVAEIKPRYHVQAGAPFYESHSDTISHIKWEFDSRYEELQKALDAARILATRTPHIRVIDTEAP